MQLIKSNLKIIFSVILVITVCSGTVITAFAYDSSWWLATSDGVTHEATGNEFVKRIFSQRPEQFSFHINNSEPSIFQGGYLYTFDVVFGFLYPSETVNTSLTTCVNDLVSNGFTTQWYINYVFDTNNIKVYYMDGSGQYHNFVLGMEGGTTSDQMFYVSSDECVVIYNSTVYHGSLSESLEQNTNGRLYIQQKIHFQFTTPDTIREFQVDWYLHNFGDWNQDNAETFEGLFDVSGLVSMDNSLAQVQVNILDSISFVSNQVSALASDISTLLQQMDYYYDLLTKGWENVPDGNPLPQLGILPNIYEMLYSIDDGITALWLFTIRAEQKIDSIDTTTKIIQHLLDTRTNNFWKWLDENFNTIHTDLITTNDYLNQIVEYIGVNDTDTQSKIEQIQVELGSTEDSIMSSTEGYFDDTSYNTVSTWLDEFDSVFVSQNTLNGATLAFKDGLTFMNFTLTGLFGVISCFVFYKLMIKLWGMLYFDE